MWRTTFGMARVVALTFVMALCSYPQTLKIWPGIAPGSEKWTQEERVEKNTPIGTVVFNVVTPTLTVYLPERPKATGTGIIIASGGAFVALAIDLEGHDVARWLQAKGIAAFVLKYRIMEKRQEGIPQMNMDEAGKYGIADGMQALKVVRRHTAEWGILPAGSALWVSRPAPWSRAQLCSNRMPPHGRILLHLSTVDRSERCQPFRLSCRQFSWHGHRTTPWPSTLWLSFMTR